jgi:hypothetical protein
MELILLKWGLVLGLFALLVYKLVWVILNSAQSLNAQTLLMGLVGLLWLMGGVLALAMWPRPLVGVLILLCWAVCWLVMTNAPDK